MVEVISDDNKIEEESDREFEKTKSFLLKNLRSSVIIILIIFICTVFLYLNCPRDLLKYLIAIDGVLLLIAFFMLLATRYMIKANRSYLRKEATRKFIKSQKTKNQTNG